MAEFSRRRAPVCKTQFPQRLLSALLFLSCPIFAAESRGATAPAKVPDDHAQQMAKGLELFKNHVGAFLTEHCVLGLTVGCARCHDHKYDPIPQTDYYRLLPTFTTTVRSEPELDFHQERYRKAKAEFDRDHAVLVEALAQFEKEKLAGRLEEWLKSGAPAPQPKWMFLDLVKVLVSTEGLPAVRLHTQGADFSEKTYFLRRGDWNQKQGEATQIMTSAVYMQSCDSDSTRANVDPENKLLWRRPRQRLEAETIRDAVLAVSGTLDRRMFGPGTLSEENRRRSFYFTVKGSQLIPMMVQFDAPDGLQGLGQRSRTTVAPQALLLLNHAQVRACARAFGQRHPPQPWSCGGQREIFFRRMASLSGGGQP